MRPSGASDKVVRGYLAPHALRVKVSRRLVRRCHPEIFKARPRLNKATCACPLALTHGKSDAASSVSDQAADSGETRRRRQRGAERGIHSTKPTAELGMPKAVVGPTDAKLSPELEAAREAAAVESLRAKEEEEARISRENQEQQQSRELITGLESKELSPEILAAREAAAAVDHDASAVAVVAGARGAVVGRAVGALA